MSTDVVPVEVAAGELVPVEADPWDLLVERWLSLYPPNTQEAYRADIGRWRDYVHAEGVTLATAGRVHFLSWCGELRELRKPSGQPYARTTRARWESSVTSFHDYAAEIDPTGGYHAIGHPKGAKARTRPGEPESPTPALSGEQVTHLLTATAEADPLVWLVCLLLYMTACRVTELVGMRVGDVRQERGAVYIRITRKGDKAGIARLDARTGDLVLRMIDGRAPAEQFLPLRHRAHAAALVKRGGELAGLPLELTPHVLRTSAINVTIDKQSMQAAQQLAGHARMSTTEIYFRRLTRDREAGVTAALLGTYVPDLEPATTPTGDERM